MPPPCRVLYVDDESDLFDIARLYLEMDEFFSVDCALSGKEALSRIADGHYDAVVADYAMPEMNGITLLQKVRETNKTLPFILFTGRGREEVVIEAINSGADFYLQKGGDPEALYAELAHKIRTAVERRRSENALKESEEQYRSLVETTGTGYVILDKDGRVITANQEYLRLCGRSTLADIEGRAVTDWTAPHDLERNAREVEQCLEKGRVRVLEIDYQKPDGTIQPVEINASVIRSGPTPIILTLCRDISERRKADEALRESEVRLRTMIEQSPLSIQVLSPDGRTVQVNRAFEELWGVTLENLKDYNMLADEQLASLGIMSYIRRGFAGEAVTIPSVEYNSRKTLGVGKTTWVLGHIYPVRDPAGTIRNVVIVHEDITERKRAERELAKKNEELMASYEQLTASEEELKSQFDALAERERSLRVSEERLIMAQEIGHSGCWEYSFETHKIWGSAEALRIYGFPPVAGYYPLEDIEACFEDRERVHQAFVDFINGRTDYDREITIHPADGSSPRRVHSLARLEKDTQGKPVRISGVIQDITDRRIARYTTGCVDT